MSPDGLLDTLTGISVTELTPLVSELVVEYIVLITVELSKTITIRLFILDSLKFTLSMSL